MSSKRIAISVSEATAHSLVARDLHCLCAFTCFIAQGLPAYWVYNLTSFVARDLHIGSTPTLSLWLELFIGFMSTLALWLEPFIGVSSVLLHQQHAFLLLFIYVLQTSPSPLPLYRISLIFYFSFNMNV